MATDAERILLTDGDAARVQRMRAVLEGAGFRVAHAASLDDAAARWQEAAPAVAILDGEMASRAACERLRALTPAGGHTPLVLWRSDEGADDAEAALHRWLEVGADDLWSVAIAPAEVLVRLQSLLRQRRAGERIERDLAGVRAERDQLRASEQRRQDFIAQVVHDLKNPLTNIMANGHFLVDEPDMPPSAHDAIVDIVDGAEAMHRMVLNILDVGRGEENALTPRTSDFDAVEMLHETVRRMRHSAEERRVRLEVVAEPASIVVRADAEMFRRLIENLVENGVRFSPLGESVEIHLRRAGGAVTLCVGDHAERLPDDVRARVFDKYARLDKSQPMVPGSRGLGLAFCRYAAEAHGGRTWVEDNAPVGNRFCASLPSP